jgi:chromosomal replication initiator protein
VLKVVADHLKTSVAMLASSQKTAGPVRDRQMCCYVLRAARGWSTLRIGRLLGGRDHSTVLHAVRKMRDLRKRDPELNQQLTELIRVIGQLH